MAQPRKRRPPGPGRPRGVTPDGERIRELRIERGLTIAQLAELTRCRPATIKMTEQGSRPISKLLASKLALALTRAARQLIPPKPDVAVADILADPRQFAGGSGEELKPTG